MFQDQSEEAIGFSQSYTLGPAKWGDSPVLSTWGGLVTWSFAEANFAGQPYQYDAWISDAAQRSLIRQAFSRWDGVANIELRESADAPGVDIRLGLDAMDGPRNVVAEAYSFYQFGIYVASLIRFDMAENFSTTGGLPPAGAINFYTVALHEIGHSLGLKHENNIPTIMNSRLNATLTDLTADDIAGIQALYGPDAVSPPPPPPPLPDLDVNATPTLGAAAVARGGAVTFSYLVDNLGTALAGASTSGIYLSTDNAITTADTLLATDAVAGLAAGGQTARSVSATIPGTLAAGSYYLGVIPDHANAIAESNETNNPSIGIALTVTAPPPPPLPDLDVSLTPTLGAASVLRGNAVTFSYAVDNFGTALAGASTSGIYLSTDNAITTADTLLTTDAVATIAAGGQSARSVSATIPGTLAAGGYYLGVIPDHANAIAESNETNNPSIGIALTVTAPPPPAPPVVARMDGVGNVIGTNAADLIDSTSPFVTNGPDTMFGGSGDDTMFGGNSGAAIGFADYLIGDDGDDQIFGEGGMDALFGRVGNDRLDGGADTDLVFGEEGDDRLVGGTGLDALLGGPGADRFVLTADASNANMEGVFDFNRAEGDKIEFSGAAFAGVATAARAVASQTTIQGGLLVNGQLVPTLYTIINFGTAAAPQILLVGGNLTLVESDFIVTG
ncbi:MAG: matrixin family metalloprotease [Alphaproteobacteria bacterium]|nr:matrixin family metalloprotease [Alphaproteobacteria bacterium]